MVNFKHALSGLMLGTFMSAGVAAQDKADVSVDIDRLTSAVSQKAIAWRHDFHEHPELSNREFRTAKVIADHLTDLGFDQVVTGVAHTGVVGVLKGEHDGPVVALRSDMDALPVTEQTGLPFASKVMADYNGKQVGVMHACGHDAHMSVLMGVAEVLSGMRDQINGSVVFIFQPAEEGPPRGETGGAKLMVEEGVLTKYGEVSAIFGLHVWPGPPGQISYRARGAMAAADSLRITVKGEQTHGSSPWLGVDPITIAGQITSAIQTIPSRSLDITKAPSVISIGSIHGGVRGNIIPDEVTLEGTIRTFDPDVREALLARLNKTVTDIATAGGATAEVETFLAAPLTYNDPALTAQMMPSVVKAIGAQNVVEGPLIMASEDFSEFQAKVPGLFLFLGINKADQGSVKPAPNHSPFFYVNDDALTSGIKTLSTLAVDYLNAQRD